MTHKHALRETAKFATGLLAGDFLAGLWLSSSHMLPIVFWGVVWTPSAVAAWMAFDIVLIIILAHYAWHASVLAPSIRQKNLLILVGIVTGVIAVVHFLRLLFGTSVVIGGWTAPLWLSWIGAAGAAFISYASFIFAGK